MESSISNNSSTEPEPTSTLSTKQHTLPRIDQESNKATVRRSSKTGTQVKKICVGGGDTANDGSSGGAEGSDEKAEVEKKIVALQKVVPGGESLCADELFEETAEYILTLQCQIKVLRFLAAFVEGPEIEKRKLGG